MKTFLVHIEGDNQRTFSYSFDGSDENASLIGQGLLFSHDYCPGDAWEVYEWLGALPLPNIEVPWTLFVQNCMPNGLRLVEYNSY